MKETIFLIVRQNTKILIFHILWLWLNARGLNQKEMEKIIILHILLRVPFLKNDQDILIRDLHLFLCCCFVGMLQLSYIRNASQVLATCTPKFE